jgi:crotonobetainyl-CoA:carnitine CoA-transferase CaiB-like acyl-CoA transferase
MTARRVATSLQDVLEWFAMEQPRDGEVLSRYLQEYPQYAEDLVDLSLEIFQLELHADRELSECDDARIHSAWIALQASMQATVADPLAQLPVDQLRELSQSLQLPRQVILALTERTVIPTTLPRSFIERLSNLLGASTQTLVQAFALPQQSFDRAFKADIKPKALHQIPFEQVLREAGVSEEQIKQLTAKGA